MTETELLEVIAGIRKALEEKNAKIAALERRIRELEREQVEEQPEEDTSPNGGGIGLMQGLVGRTFDVRTHSYSDTASAKLEAFIKKCISPTEPGKAFILSPETAAVVLDVSVRMKNSFIRILTETRHPKDNRPLVIYSRSEGKFYSNYTAEEVLRAITNMASHNGSL